MQSSVPKQFMEVKGKPILLHTVEKFYNSKYKPEIILVLPEHHIPKWDSICSDYNVKIPHSVCIGGSERFFSVKNGLSPIKEEGIVAIHDGVRPLVSNEVIERTFKIATEKGNAIPYINVKDSVRSLNEKNSGVIDREKIALIQTPQCFIVSEIKKAYTQSYSEYFTDDASVFEAAGGRVNLCDGNQENIKITTPIDLKIAESII